MLPQMDRCSCFPHFQRVYSSVFSALDDANSVPLCADDLLQRMSGVLQLYGVDPRELNQEQLYKLALILQLLQAQDKTGNLIRWNISFGIDLTYPSGKKSFFSSIKFQPTNQTC